MSIRPSGPVCDAMKRRSAPTIRATAGLVDAAVVAQEAPVDGYVAEHGFATPPALRFGRYDDYVVFLVMSRVPGTTLFESAGPRRSLREVPARLAGRLVDLHDLDPKQIRAALQPESAANAWYDSNDYQAVIGHRHQAANSNVAVFEGFTPPKPDQ